MAFKMKGMSFKDSPIRKNGDKVKDTASKKRLSAENPDTYVYKGNKKNSDKDNITIKIASMEDRVSAIKEDIANKVFEGSDLDRAKNDISTINDQISKLKALRAK